MTRRQKKKNYKKKYGFNPQKEEMEITTSIDLKELSMACASLGERMREAVDYIAKVVMPRLAESMQNVIEEYSKEIKKTIIQIKEMPEDEWKQFKKNSTLEQITIAEIYRSKQ